MTVLKASPLDLYYMRISDPNWTGSGFLSGFIGAFNMWNGHVFDAVVYARAQGAELFSPPVGADPINTTFTGAISISGNNLVVSDAFGWSSSAGSFDVTVGPSLTTLSISLSETLPDSRAGFSQTLNLPGGPVVLATSITALGLINVPTGYLAWIPSGTWPGSNPAGAAGLTVESV